MKLFYRIQLSKNLHLPAVHHIVNEHSHILKTYKVTLSVSNGTKLIQKTFILLVRIYIYLVANKLHAIYCSMRGGL